MYRTGWKKAKAVNDKTLIHPHAFDKTKVSLSYIFEPIVKIFCISVLISANIIYFCISSDINNTYERLLARDAKVAAFVVLAQISWRLFGRAKGFIFYIHLSFCKQIQSQLPISLGIVNVTSQ